MFILPVPIAATPLAPSRGREELISSFWVGSTATENVKWLEVNRIINVLSVGEYPFKSEKIGVKRPKKRPNTDELKGAKENGDTDHDEEDDGNTDGEVEGEKAREAKKEAKKRLNRRIYPPHFKVYFLTYTRDVPS